MGKKRQMKKYIISNSLFFEFYNSIVITRQNVKVALACQPVLQYKKPRCGG